MIRPATLNDAKQCYDLAYEMYAEFMLKYGIEVIREDLQKTVELFITSGQNLVIERDNGVVGMTAWILTSHPANSRLQVFQEVLWCVNSPFKTDALILLRAIEKKAKELKADIVCLANLSEMNEGRLRDLYGRMGYDFMESHYVRKIGD